MVTEPPEPTKNRTMVTPSTPPFAASLRMASSVRQRALPGTSARQFAWVIRTGLEDAIEASSKPVLITHANCRALVPGSARCRTDEAIRKLAAKRGVLGVTMVRFFVGSGGSVTMQNVLDHIDHVVKIAGVEHVGIGSDVDLDGRDPAKGMAPSARKNDLDGIHYSRKIFDLTEGLVRRNYSRQNIELILGGNFQRALSEIWTA